jgi:monoamine oxidase
MAPLHHTTITGSVLCPWSTAWLAHLPPLLVTPRPQVKARLQQLYPDTYQDPTAAIIHRWAADPFSYGSYSYAAVGSRPSHRTALAATQGLWYFAGEHAHPDYSATINGAYLTGKDAARKLLACRNTGVCT